MQLCDTYPMNVLKMALDGHKGGTVLALQPSNHMNRYYSTYRRKSNNLLERKLQAKRREDDAQELISIVKPKKNTLI